MTMDTVYGHILVVEDSTVNQKLLYRLLTRNGFAVDVAGSAEEALEFLEKGGAGLPDLIVLDIIMPGMDGIELCSRLKSRPAFRDIPVIFISALDNAEDKVRGFEAGGVDYVTKPFHSGEVLVRINTHLKLCRLQRQLEEKNRQLHNEKQKSEALLLNVLPRRVAQELIEKGTFTPQSYRNVTVCFIDLVQFTAAASRLDPEVLIRELNDIFSGFDDIANRYGCERMKTIGDAYLCTCGIPKADPQHVHRMADAALEMITFLKQRNREADHRWQVRIGLHTGNVVGGIVGTNKYLYDIFGDTVNIASRLEALSLPMRINVSQEIQSRLQQTFIFSEPIRIHMKGKGLQATYFLEGRRQEAA